MTLKEQVLLLLENQRESFLSGQEIARQLFVTRASVWKAVKALQKDGYAIEAVNNKGYILRKAPDVLSGVYIERKLRDAGILLKAEVKRQVDSTNNVLKQYAAAGETEDMLLLAEEQSAGRGRRGHSFYSPEETGLYMSLLLHPAVTPGEAAMLTTLAAVAAARAIEAVSGEAVQIKWVNDVWLRGKKITGILTEASASMEEGKLEYVVVGVGINLYEPKDGFPQEIREIAGAVFSDSIPRENLRSRLAAEFIIFFMEYYRAFPAGSYLEEYRKRCFVIGKRVRILPTGGAENRAEDGKTAAGTGNAMVKDREYALVLGIDDQCHLKVQYDDGETEFLSSGEISIKV